MRVKVGVLPSLVTLGNLICGFAAIGVTVRARLEWKETISSEGWQTFAFAGALILLAMVFDALDGKIARMSNQTTEFGAQLDSLCDMVSFGMAPAYIVFLLAASKEVFPHYRYAYVCAPLYAVCTALRLARFNVETAPDEESHRFFRGLPSPAAAGVIASLAIFCFETPGAARWAAAFMPFAAIIVGGLMISRIPYVHLLNLFFSGRKPFTYLVVFVFSLFFLILFAHEYEYLLLIGFGGYTLSGPVLFAVARLRRRRFPVPKARPPAEPEPKAEEDEASIF